tara:strand:+ start:45 stop:668 length:624 start_codon:yes stop_codon:yes gene_type:complete
MNKIQAMVTTLTMLVGVTGCANNPPTKQQNICAIFEQNREWYDFAKTSEKKWGTTIPILMSFVRQESSFRSKAKPPYKWLWFIPLGRQSSAKGYAQAQDAVWGEYKYERGGLFKSRSDMEDALDFIGWYNHKSHTRLGISRDNAKEMYLAYHEGRAGYRRKSYNKKPKLLEISSKVAKIAKTYNNQLKGCEEQFKCRKWYQLWPFCS